MLGAEEESVEMSGEESKYSGSGSQREEVAKGDKLKEKQKQKKQSK